MFWDLEVTPDDEEQLILGVAKEIRRYGMDVAAILFLESSKPLTFLGAQMGRAFISPFLPAISEDLGVKSEKLFRIFENRANVEKLISVLEELEREEDKKKREKKKKEKEAKLAEQGELVEAPEKKGWRRYLPF